MKKWKHLLKAVMAVGVIAMTAVQICAAAEGTAQITMTEAWKSNRHTRVKMQNRPGRAAKRGEYTATLPAIAKPGTRLSCRKPFTLQT